MWCFSQTRCFCGSDTHHFSCFCRFPGSEKQSPLFLWVECKIAMFATFVKTLGPANNHPWMLTTLGCPRTPGPRNSSVDKFLSRGIPLLRAPWAEPRGMVSLSSEIPRFRIPWLRNSSTEEFLGARGSRAYKGGEHPRMVIGRPKTPVFRQGREQKHRFPKHCLDNPEHGMAAFQTMGLGLSRDLLPLRPFKPQPLFTS